MKANDFFRSKPHDPIDAIIYSMESSGLDCFEAELDGDADKKREEILRKIIQEKEEKRAHNECARA